MHRFASADTKFANLLEINTDIGPTYLYDRTKLAQVLFVRHLVKLLSYSHSAIGEHNKIYINATHPVGVATDEQKQAEEAYGTLGKIGVAAVKPFMKDPVDQGCRPALWAATSPEVVEGNVTGQYIVLDKKVTEPSSQAQDEELAKQLWVLSEEILRDKLGRLPYEPLGVWVADGMTGTE
jgi:WW domain-containing oxidoreductase